MNNEIRQRIHAFRQALEQAASACSVDPSLVGWHNFIRDFPLGCCELASQTLVRYLREHDKHRFPCVISMDWSEGAEGHGHVIVALDGDYIDLTLDQFPGYDDYIEAEPIESGGKMAAFIQHVRRLGGSFTMHELSLDGIGDESEKLYSWLKESADRMLPVAAEAEAGCPVSRDILAEYRDNADNR